MVLVHDPDRPRMRVGDRRDKHIALLQIDRSSRDKREEHSEHRKDTEEEVREGVRDLHVHDDCRKICLVWGV